MSSESAPTKEYVGGCHCKKFRYKFTHVAFENGESEVVSCNCSSCTMSGWLVVSAPAGSFQFTSGSLDELTLYEFNKKIYKHRFCPTCGTEVVITGHNSYGVNVRTVDGVEVDKLKLKFFDGKNLM